MDSTGKAFVDHWKYAAERGVMNANTAGSMRAAAQAVLEIAPEWETIDVAEMDVDDFIRRFQTLKGKEYKPDSLREYARRFRKSRESFLQYLKDPSAWRPAQRPARVTPNGRPDAPAPNTKPLGTVPPHRMPLPEPTREGFIDHQFPLNDGRIARMSLPTDLKAADVRRLNAFLGALVVDEGPA